MTRMFRALIAASLLVFAPHAPDEGEQAKAAAVAPQELARLWDAEHVSPPLPPLLEHDEIERRLQAVSHADPSRFIFERVGASGEGRSINMQKRVVLYRCKAGPTVGPQSPEVGWQFVWPG